MPELHFWDWLSINRDRCIPAKCYISAKLLISCTARLIERLLCECVLNEVCQRLVAVLEAAVPSLRMKERAKAIGYGSLPCEWEKVYRFVCMLHYLPITLNVCVWGARRFLCRIAILFLTWCDTGHIISAHVCIVFFKVVSSHSWRLYLLVSMEVCVGSICCLCSPGLLSHYNFGQIKAHGNQAAKSSNG